MTDASETVTSPLRLESLVPRFVSDQHGTYRDELVDLLTDDDRRARVWNIALTGGYGSGKSSVLAGVRDQLGKRVVEISLSSLSDVGVERGDDLNNYIQKEIVKQLLYRERPSRVPGSRFKRISRLPVGRTLVASALVAVLIALTLWITGWGAPFQLAPANEGMRVPLLLSAALIAGVIAYVVMALLHNRIRIDKLGTSATSVSLTAESDGGSYFDEYLDEIVYFFEKTRRDIVIIEDLDRFEDPTIYASLRELNTVLNTSRQLRKRPVHFVYAVRDSIFEDLEVPRDTPDGPDAAPGVWQADRGLSDAATQRTKFFELVVPIVPFITHRSSADLLFDLAAEADSAISFEAVRVVAKHVTDMRLLRNILNEFRVFHARVLAGGKLGGLTSSGLFALVAYKNTHMKQFELIRVGSSELDVLYRRSREIIASGMDTASATLAALREQGTQIAATDARAEQLGAALQDLVERWLPRVHRRGHTATYRIGGADWAPAALSTARFWEAAIDSGHALQVVVNGEVLFELTADEIAADLGVPVPARWSDQVVADTAAASEDARAELQWYRTADFQQLLMRQTSDSSSRLIRGTVDPLLHDLLAEGLIDRNFALYASEFYGVIASAAAMTYVIQHLQADTPDHDYPLDEKDVDAVLELGGPRAFESTGLFNIAIYDQLLAREDGRLAKNIAALAVADPAAVGFMRSYLQRGRLPATLISRVAAQWDGVFKFIDTEGPAVAADQLDLVVAAFESLNPELEYEVPDDVKRLLAENPGRLTELSADGTPQRATAALTQLGVSLADIRALPPAAQRSVVVARRYEVNAPNLEVAVGGGDIALDAIMQLEDPTFDHVLGHFEAYLSSIDASHRPSITDVDMAVDVMEAAELSRAGAASEIARRMPAEMLIRDINAVPATLLPVLAESHRFPLTFANVTNYIAVRSLDAPLIEYLAASPTLAVPPETDVTARITLAARLVSEDELDVAARVTLAGQLVDTVPASRSMGDEADLVTALMNAGLLDDSASTFQALATAHAQEAFVVESQTAPDWIVSSNASATLVASLLRNPDVSPRVKTLLADAIPRNAAWGSTDVLEALGAWAEVTREPLPAETLQLMQMSGASTSSKVAALSASVATVPGLVPQYVAQLGGAYAEVLQPANTYVDLPLVPDPTPFLELLKDSDTAVSSFNEVDGVMRVYRHRPRPNGD